MRLTVNVFIGNMEVNRNPVIRFQHHSPIYGITHGLLTSCAMTISTEDKWKWENKSVMEFANQSQ